jgi:hypothetical protein
MANKNYKLTVVDGQVKVINTKGNIVDVELMEGVEITMKTPEEIKTMAETGIQVAAEVADTEDKHAHQEIPDYMGGKFGVCYYKGQYYFVCTHCGSYVSLKQAEYSIKHWDRVICIDCQRAHRSTGKYLTSPESRFSKEVKFSKPCDNPKCVDKDAKAEGKTQRRMITGSQLNLSLKLTGGQYGLCPHCLVKFAASKPIVKAAAPAELPVAQGQEDAVPQF